MKDERGLMAAITAAIDAYIEQEAALLEEIPLVRPQMATSLWGSSGREEIMRMRGLWQRRIVSR